MRNYIPKILPLQKTAMETYLYNTGKQKCNEFCVDQKVTTGEH